MSKNSFVTRSVCGTAVACFAISAGASVVDLTDSNSSGIINGVRFESADYRPAGTGNVDSIVRIQAHNAEQGYNTSGRSVPFDEKKDPNFTRDLRLTDLLITSIDGVACYEFRLDANEENAGSKSLISLDRLQIYTSAVGSQTTSNVASLGTKCYDLDLGGDNWVKIESRRNAGSGRGDMNVFVPVSFFAGSSPDDFVYLYSYFGTNYATGGGFEEWDAVLVPSTGGSVVLSAIAGLMLVRRRRAA